MKRIISMLACAAAVICSCQKESLPGLSFESGTYVMGADEAIVVKVVTTTAPTADLTVDFNLAGSATEGTDYELSAKSFVIKAGETVGEITVTPLNNLASSLKIALTLNLPTGYEAGKFTSTNISLASKEKAAYSFAKSDDELVGEVNVTLNLIGEESETNFVAGGRYEFPFVLDAASTAVLGTDFEVKDGATAFVFEKGSNSASITLKTIISTSPKTIVIKLDEAAIAAAYGERFSAGVKGSTTVVIKREITFDDLVGKWAYAGAPILQSDGTDGIDISTISFVLEDAGEGALNAAGTLDIYGYPTGTASDVIEFNYIDGKPSLSPSGTGSVMSYFKECEVTAIAPETYSWYNFYPAKPVNGAKLSLSAANTLYSAAQENIKPADIIVSLSEDGNTLDLFITTKSYTPADFFVMSYMVFGDMWGVEGFEDYVGLYDIYYTFTKVAE